MKHSSKKLCTTRKNRRKTLTLMKNTENETYIMCLQRTTLPGFRHPRSKCQHDKRGNLDVSECACKTILSSQMYI